VSSQHLSDEAVAAFADGVLTGHARERAVRHVNACPECRQAVRVQREAAFALRSACAPQLPVGLVDRLRTVPLTTPIPSVPSTVTSDGTAMMSTVGPVAALVPHQGRRTHRVRPYITTAAIVALAGTLAAGSVGRQDGTSEPGTDHVIGQHVTPTRGHHADAVVPVSLFRGN
jgi:anti-sigma factor RsiW